ncbi:multidrug effflux MFS transporter [Tropicimonas marinistellae]|uniref:multidrug effflux MFS transporter n=1 Tax=Tropicimonas marinistellae TaxID=1739787 RepID=UPI000AAA2BBC|nr:multidrug effflux MFS transporter [Tropicimonas marinistellae]
MSQTDAMPSSPTVRFLDRTTPPHIVTLVLLAGLSAMNMSVFLPSLPTMTRHFETDYATMQLSVSMYLATTAVLQLAIGPISDKYGRRPVVMWSILVFLLATAGCLFAASAGMFLVCRMVQGVVIMGLVLSRAVVRDMYPQDEAASRIGYVTMGMALVPMFAPMIGGTLEQLFGWQSSFVFLLLIGALIGLVSWADLGETASHTGATFGQQAREYPELLGSPRFWGYALSSAFSAGAFFAFLGGAPYVASTIFDLAPIWTGLSLGAPAVGYMLGNYVSGRFSARYGINPMIFWGSVLTSTGMLLSLVIGAAGYHSPAIFFSFVTTVGLGNGMVIPNATAGMLSVRPQLAGTASGLGGFIMVAGGAALSVLAGHVLEGAETPMPLQLLMMIASALGTLSIIYVRRRERRLRLAS